jgi:DeoR/GlpR family transcriptional regulator of sugar metabolism
MKFDDYEQKLYQLLNLIEHANTGSPKDLARHLNVSERTIRRLIEKLKLRKYSIRFCRKSNSYLLND